MHNILSELDIQPENLGGFAGEWLGGGESLSSVSPIDARPIAKVQVVTEADYDRIASGAQAAFFEWRTVPAPARGDLVRQLGNALREHQQALGELVTWEMGKIRAEGVGEVQEMIDICDFAVGLSRQLYGLTMHSERPVIACTSNGIRWGRGSHLAFNFPVAVWSWNAALAAVCGERELWKPSSADPSDRDRLHEDRPRASGRTIGVNPAIFSLVIGPGATIGERLISDRRIPLVSATGSLSAWVTGGSRCGQRTGRDASWNWVATTPSS